MKQAPFDTAASACPMCGVLGRLALSQPDIYLGVRADLSHDLYFCRACRLYFQQEIGNDSLAQFYPTEYYARAALGPLRATFSRLRNRRRARAVEWRACSGQILDIGCGRGEVLSALKERGWQCVGMDWNADNAARVSANLSIEIVGGPDALSRLADGRFQAISLFHVLEHEQRPLDLLAEIRRLLVPGGRLVVGVPNGASLARLLFGRFWMGYDLPRHRYTFTPKSLREMLMRAGFEIERRTGRLSDEWLDLAGSAKQFCRRHGVHGRLLPALLMLLLVGPITFASFLGYGSTVYVYASKR